MSLTVSEIAHCQTLIYNEFNELVGVIHGKDTFHAIPIVESRVLHEFAVRKLYLDSMVQVRENLIVNLELRLSRVESGYENLLDNSGKTADQLRKEIKIAKDERDEFKKELRKLKRKLLWANIRTGAVAVLGAIIVWLTSK